MLKKSLSYNSKVCCALHHWVENFESVNGKAKMKELNTWVVFNLMLCKINFRSGTKGQERPDS